MGAIAWAHVFKDFTGCGGGMSELFNNVCKVRACGAAKLMNIIALLFYFIVTKFFLYRI